MEAFKTYFFGRSTADREASKAATFARRHGTPTLTHNHHNAFSHRSLDTDSMKRVDSAISEKGSSQRIRNVLVTQYTPAEIHEHNWRTVALWLYMQQQRKSRISGRADEGVIIKTTTEPEQYICHPADLETTAAGFVDAVKMLDYRAAITMRSPTISAIFADTTTTDLVPLADGIMVQVVPDMAALATALDAHAFAAWVTEADCLVVWDEQAKDLIACCDALEEALIRREWDAVRMDT